MVTLIIYIHRPNRPKKTPPLQPLRTHTHHTMSTECTPPPPPTTLLAELSLSSPTPLTPSAGPAPSRAPPTDPDTLAIGTEEIGTEETGTETGGPRILQLSIPLPNTHLPTRVHLHLTITPLSVLLFLTTRLGSQPRDSILPVQPQLPEQSCRSESVIAASASVNPLDQITKPPPAAASGGAEMGSFVLAMPDVRAPPRHGTVLNLLPSSCLLNPKFSPLILFLPCT